MRNKFVGAILAFIVGSLGIHKFYLRDKGQGMWRLMLFIFAAVAEIPIVMTILTILAIIDGISLITMPQNAFDSKYNQGQPSRPPRRGRRQTDYEREIATRRSREKERNEEMRRYRDRRHRPAPKPKRPKRPRNNPYKESGIKKFKDYDYDGAIEDFLKALEVEDRDPAIHFNLACAYSLNEEVQKSFQHLDKAVILGFKDVKKIKEHDALAFLRVQPEFDAFEENDFRLTKEVSAKKEKNLLDSKPGLLDQIKKLDELRRKGILNEEEYVLEKKKLLG